MKKPTVDAYASLSIPKQTPAKEKIKGEFSSNAFNLLAKLGYDFDNPKKLGEVIEVEPHGGLNETQKKIYVIEGKVGNDKSGIGFKSTPNKFLQGVNKINLQAITSL